MPSIDPNIGNIGAGGAFLLLAIVIILANVFGKKQNEISNEEPDRENTPNEIQEMDDDTKQQLTDLRDEVGELRRKNRRLEEEIRKLKANQNNTITSEN